jgi:outer membrane biosynthesis protein TonB
VNVDPLDRILLLDARMSGWGPLVGFTGTSGLILGALVALLMSTTWPRSRRVPVLDEIDVLTQQAVEAPVTPPAAPSPPPIEARHVTEPVEPAPRTATREPLTTPAPAPAAAAKVLTSEPDPAEPVDFTGNTLVQGNADVYGGGYTASNGTGAGVQTFRSRGGLTPGGPAVLKWAATSDDSRGASLGDGDEWNCPFPAESGAAQIDEAYVTLIVDVAVDGSARAVRVLSDPGSGFGREARQCAMSKRYVTALDREGRALSGTTKPIRVHFSR